eukprot:6183651-Pleurochrysis_carterae.AAC.1
MQARPSTCPRACTRTDRAMSQQTRAAHSRQGQRTTTHAVQPENTTRSQPDSAPCPSRLKGKKYRSAKRQQLTRLWNRVVWLFQANAVERRLNDELFAAEERGEVHGHARMSKFSRMRDELVFTAHMRFKFGRWRSHAQ